MTKPITREDIKNSIGEKKFQCHCGNNTWYLELHCLDLHGYGLRCSKCGVNFWTGKKSGSSARRNNYWHRQKHTENGAFCALCNLTEKELTAIGQRLQVDHVKEIQNGGDDNFENTILLCDSCHYLKNSVSHKTESIRKLLAEKAAAK